MKKQMKWVDTIDAGRRAEELVEQMDLVEAASQLRYNAPPIPRLNIPDYNWWNEALHGVARMGTATVFPQAIGMAAMFDDDYLRSIADTVSTEARAKYNEWQRKGSHDMYQGLTMWSPNINIFRDPRWGRGQETYGEDPYLTTRMGMAYVQGLQGEGKYLKTAACAKHFAVHSGPERGRHEFNSVASKKDMWETYLPAFEALVKEAGVESVMGAYNRLNGEVCCGSQTLLVDILREKWGFDGHVVSDCGAIMDFHANHKVTKTPEESAALALEKGCDLNCGSVYLSAVRAVEQGLIGEQVVRKCAARLMRARIRMGMFDTDCEYDAIPYTENDSPEHREMAVEAARKSMVLLKNDGILPLDKNKLSSIAVIGPNADSQLVLEGNYNGVSSRYITALEGISDAVGENTRVYYARGCGLFQDGDTNGYAPDLADRNWIPEAVSAAERADVAVLCLGLSPNIEGEEMDVYNSVLSGGDRCALDLPGNQQQLLEAVCATGKPVVVVLFTGSALAVNWADEHCNAILNAWYPGGRGGRAVADILFGNCSPSGKLPITFYRSLDGLPAFEDYSMKGRTYRYLTQTPLYPFGYGLSYTKMELSNLNAPAKASAGEAVTLSATLTNTGGYDAEEVVQVYVKDLESPLAPPHACLREFARVALKKGESKEVTFTLEPRSFQQVNEEWELVYDSSRFAIYVGLSQPDERSVLLTGQSPLKGELHLQRS